MAIKFKHKLTKKVVEYDQVMGLFYAEGNKPEDCYKSTGFPIPISPLEIKKDSNWEYFESNESEKDKIK